MNSIRKHAESLKTDEEVGEGKTIDYTLYNYGKNPFLISTLLKKFAWKAKLKVQLYFSILDLVWHNWFCVQLSLDLAWLWIKCLSNEAIMHLKPLSSQETRKFSVDSCRLLKSNAKNVAFRKIYRVCFSRHKSFLMIWNHPKWFMKTFLFKK